MAQATVVRKLSQAEGDALEAQLAAGSFEFRQVPHARFSAKGEGVVVTLYSSGKLVVQGAEPELFLGRYGLAGGDAASASEPAAAKKSPSARHSGSLDPSPGWAGARDGSRAREAQPARTTVGSDEAGKGDFFGPLVVVALRLPAEDADALTAGGVVDSKRLSDGRARRLGAALLERYSPAVERLDPADYNPAWTARGNLNVLLAELHARAIGTAASKGDLVVVDQFGSERLMIDALGSTDFELVQRPRAEEIPAVAAASVVARMVFLEALDELSERFAIDLAKGAGPPVDRVAAEFCRLHGRERLGDVAKLHFKNASRLA